VWTTAEVEIPKDPLALIIGQDEAVRTARVVARQRRHLLLVGPPGTGKSMIAQAIASLIPPPSEEISVLHNPENPEKPIVEVRKREEVKAEAARKIEGKVVSPAEVPAFVAERLGFRCRRCGMLSSPDAPACPECGADKYRKEATPFDDLILGFVADVREDRVQTTRKLPNGKEEVIALERTEDGKILMLDGRALKRRERNAREKPRKVIVPLDRKTFVQATGASETELVGDVRHDPYGGHPEIGSLPYQRVVPGAVHEAHEGVLFIDEITTLGHLQRYLLTAMQEKKFPIVGRNPTSTGASVRVDGVPCDFILVGALNTNDLGSVLPPLRSRIIGNGYEVLLKAVMQDNEENCGRLVQFIAQEIRKDGKIPHADREAVGLIIEEARRRAKLIDDAAGLTLRLRDLSGIIKLAGDLAILDGSELITGEYVRRAIRESKSIEEQVSERYDSWWKAGMSDYGTKKARRRESEVA